MTANAMTTGLCHCGCGQRTQTAKYTDSSRGYVAGQPVSYVRGHNRRTAGGDVAERLWAKVRKTERCWYWTGTPESTGYGRLPIPGKRRLLVHRLAYELIIGPIPEGLTIDHLCMERTCVNPAHMEVVTRSENTRRAREHARRADRPALAPCSSCGRSMRRRTESQDRGDVTHAAHGLCRTCYMRSWAGGQA